MVNDICLPYEKHLKDEEEEESFKLLGELVIHNLGAGYTCFVQSYMFFISDQEIVMHKNRVMKLFNGVGTVEKFEALQLPIKKVTKCPDGTNNVAYEIDLTQTRILETALNSKKLDCLPILWVFSSPSYTEWTVKFE